MTANLDDFPLEPCRELGIDVQDPDTFLQHQFGLAPKEFLCSLQFLAAERRPPMDSVKGILQTLKRVAPGFVAQASAFQEHERDVAAASETGV